MKKMGCIFLEKKVKIVVFYLKLFSTLLIFGEDQHQQQKTSKIVCVCVLGISLSMDNWNRLKQLVDEVDKCLNGAK